MYPQPVSAHVCVAGPDCRQQVLLASLCIGAGNSGQVSQDSGFRAEEVVTRAVGWAELLQEGQGFLLSAVHPPSCWENLVSLEMIF